MVFRPTSSCLPKLIPTLSLLSKSWVFSLRVGGQLSSKFQLNSSIGAVLGGAAQTAQIAHSQNSSWAGKAREKTVILFVVTDRYEVYCLSDVGFVFQVHYSWSLSSVLRQGQWKRVFFSKLLERRPSEACGGSDCLAWLSWKRSHELRGHQTIWKVTTNLVLSTTICCFHLVIQHELLWRIMTASLIDNDGIIRCALTYSIASMIKNSVVEYACDHEIAVYDITPPPVQLLPHPCKCMECIIGTCRWKSDCILNVTSEYGHLVFSVKGSWCWVSMMKGIWNTIRMRVLSKVHCCYHCVKGSKYTVSCLSWFELFELVSCPNSIVELSCPPKPWAILQPCFHCPLW